MNAIRQSLKDQNFASNGNGVVKAAVSGETTKGGRPGEHVYDKPSGNPPARAFNNLQPDSVTFAKVGPNGMRFFAASMLSSLQPFDVHAVRADFANVTKSGCRLLKARASARASGGPDMPEPVTAPEPKPFFITAGMRNPVRGCIRCVQIHTLSYL